ncbi:RAI1-domain-containing protein [Ascobolus immersus RN42]|uniref:Decapping nuclease n=1 Tax=Ascobolus immersus RN42 TaxID=1160509 RepID=A0A3N4IWX6_ASCIM|nr:RAI1-domain-containing protein [Ascobolus immersus RN42]
MSYYRPEMSNQYRPDPRRHQPTQPTLDSNAKAFKWDSLEAFRGKSQLRRPQEVTTFSYDENRAYKFDDSSLRYYYNPEIGQHLSKGLDKFIKHDDTIPEHLDGLLQGIMDYEKSTGKKVSADVVTWRGMITRFLTLPYEKRDAFKMNATKFQGVIYMEDDHDFKMAQRANERPWTGPIGQEEMSFWGYKFEALATIPRIWADCTREEIEGRCDDVVNQEPQYCSVVQTGFGKTKLLIGGEVDAVWDVKPNYVELKTTKRCRTDRDFQNYEKKLLKFWAQSFLLNVPRIIVGERTDDGVLCGVQELMTSKIPSIVQKQGRSWDGNVCIRFAEQVMDWLVDEIQEGQMVKVNHPANASFLEVVEVDMPTFLTKEFIEWRTAASGKHLEH